ncbi:hypothetical protein BJK05_17455 [Pectobacterium polaris]|nr:hypothetical protein [Pectobacterium polaris]ASY82640.1 hypothetical protein BJK05_17455 [Pectobacterium polaris]
MRGLGIVLTAGQIKALAQYDVCERQLEYTITYSYIQAFTADDGSKIPQYDGLIAYSGSENSGVLQLG